MKAELYKVLYEHQTDQEDELDVKVNEIIRVTNKENPDWWLAERYTNSAESGLVPSNFIEKITHGEEEGGGDKKLAVVIQDYTAQSSDELTLESNGIITVLSQDVAEGWWQGDLNGKIGVFPSDHVSLLSSADMDDQTPKSKKDGFKLAAYGVKQGGIGSILAGGFGLKRSSTTGTRRTSTSEPQVAVPPQPLHIQTETNVPTKAMVIHDYQPENEDEIQLMRGEYVTVIDQLENDGWWKGTNEAGITGLFPLNFVQTVSSDPSSPPPRPNRTRPATVKSDQPKPPPVPVGTRPTSLLTQREPLLEHSPPPRPITLPPRPQLAPPPRRIDTTTKHKRIPSIPLMSPDLPPLMHEKSTRSMMDNKQKSPIEPLHSMAKPPKINQLVTKPKPSEMPVPPPRSPALTTEEPMPPVPKRPEQQQQQQSVPKRPEQQELPPVPKRIEQQPVPKRTEQQPVPKRTESTKRTETQDIPPVPKRVEQAPKQESNMDMAQVRRLIQAETEALRQMFQAQLEQERQERLQLQAEIQELKSLFLK